MEQEGQAAAGIKGATWPSEREGTGIPPLLGMTWQLQPPTAMHRVFPSNMLSASLLHLPLPLTSPQDPGQAQRQGGRDAGQVPHGRRRLGHPRALPTPDQGGLQKVWGLICGAIDTKRNGSIQTPTELRHQHNTKSSH